MVLGRHGHPSGRGPSIGSNQHAVLDHVHGLVAVVPDAVIVRRVLLWGALGVLVAVATHGLRDRIRRSYEATVRLQEQVGELMVVQDRDRLAADLQSSVVQRIFAAGLSLQTVLAMPPRLRYGDPPAAEASDQVLGMLRTALGLLGTPAEPTLICVEAAERLSVIVTGTGTPRQAANGDGRIRDLTAAARAGPAGRHRDRDRVGRRWDQAGLERIPASLGAKVPRPPGQRP